MMELMDVGLEGQATNISKEETIKQYVLCFLMEEQNTTYQKKKKKRT